MNEQKQAICVFVEIKRHPLRVLNNTFSFCNIIFASILIPFFIFENLHLQEEITTLFLYTVQPHLLANALTAEEMERNYRVFCRRQQGTDVGPRVNEAVEHFEAEFSHTADRSDALLVPAFPAYTSATTGSDNAAVADSTPADARITSIDAVSATGVDTAVAVSDAAPVQAEQMHEVAEQEQSIVQDEGVTMTENDAEVPTTIEAAAASVTAPAESVTIADAHAPADSEAATANRDKDHAAGVTDIAAAAAKANSDSAPPAGTSAQVAVKLLPDRPERPTLLLCPMVTFLYFLLKIYLLSFSAVVTASWFCFLMVGRFFLAKYNLFHVFSPSSFLTAIAGGGYGRCGEEGGGSLSAPSAHELRAGLHPGMLLLCTINNCWRFFLPF